MKDAISNILGKKAQERPTLLDALTEYDNAFNGQCLYTSDTSQVKSKVLLSLSDSLRGHILSMRTMSEEHKHLADAMAALTQMRKSVEKFLSELEEL